VHGLDGRLIRSVDALHRGDAFRVVLSDGQIRARVDGVEPEPASDRDVEPGKPPPPCRSRAT
jgi:hypothetical protein